MRLESMGDRIDRLYQCTIRRPRCQRRARRWWSDRFVSDVRRRALALMRLRAALHPIDQLTICVHNQGVIGREQVHQVDGILQRFGQRFIGSNVANLYITAKILNAIRHVETLQPSQNS